MTMYRILKRELLISIRKGLSYHVPLLIFLLVVILFPLAIGAEVDILKSTGPGIIWVGALLSVLFSLNHLFYDDMMDGSLEQTLFGDVSLIAVILVKVVVQWLLLIIPLIILTPLLAFMFYFSAHTLGILLASLLIGTPILMLWGSVGAAITVGLRQGSLLMILILLPLYVPTLTFASNAVRLASVGNAVAPVFAWLGVLLIISMMLTPPLAAFVLRMGIALEP